MFCSHCAAENNDDSAACFSCGTPLSDDRLSSLAPSTPPAETKAGDDALNDDWLQPTSGRISHPATPSPQLSTGPVSGWLMLFCVSVGFLTPFGAAGTLLETTTPVGSLPGPVTAFRTVSFLMTIILGIGGPVVAYRVFSKARGAITLAERFCWTAIGFYGFVFLFSGFVLNSYAPPNSPEYASLLHRSLAQAAGRALYYVGWLAYLAKSRQVADLFGPPGSNR